MNTNIKRISYIDALKGFGIILMVLGHMHFGYANCEKYIFAFHMPLFFLVSGYLYKTPIKFSDAIKKKMKGLLVPYFVFGLGYYFFWLIRNHGAEVDWVSPLKAVLLYSVEGLKSESALWFLMALFWAWLIYTLIDRYVKDTWIKVLLIAVISTVGCLWNYIVPFYLPWGIQDAFAVQIFFLLGNFYRRWEEKGSGIILSWESQGFKKKICILIIGLLLNAVLIYNCGLLNVRLGQWPAFAGSYLNAVMAVWLWAELIKCILMNKTINKTAGYVLKRIGLYSIIWLCINHPAISLSKRIVEIICANVQNAILIQAVIVIFTILIIYAIAEIIMHTPLRVLVGKWRKVAA